MGGIKKVSAELNPSISRNFIEIKNAFLVDDQGIIFLSGVPDFLYMSIFPLTKEQEKSLQAFRRYGDHKFQPLLEQTYSDGEVVEILGKKWMFYEGLIACTAPLAGAGQAGGA